MAGSTPSCQHRASVAGNTLSPRPLLASLAKKALGAVVAVGTLSAGSAQALTTWDWSFTEYANSQGGRGIGQGTFTTAGSTPVAYSLEIITAITGTYTLWNQSGESVFYEIDGLNPYVDAARTNTFKWDGSGTSPILTNSYGIAFNLKDTSNNVRIAFDITYGYWHVNAAYYDYDVTNDFISNAAISSSSLTPRSSVANVPGPLPILGLAAAFGFSRKLRKRIKLHKGTTAVSTPPGS